MTFSMTVAKMDPHLARGTKPAGLGWSCLHVRSGGRWSEETLKVLVLVAQSEGPGRASVEDEVGVHP